MTFVAPPYSYPSFYSSLPAYLQGNYGGVVGYYNYGPSYGYFNGSGYGGTTYLSGSYAAYQEYAGYSAPAYGGYYALTTAH